MSSDGGLSWHAKGVITTGGSWLIEGTLATKEDGAVLHYFRSKKGLIYQSVSGDGGSTWKKPKPTKMPNPNSKVNLLRLTTGEFALAFNDEADSRITQVSKPTQHAGRAVCPQLDRFEFSHPREDAYSPSWPNRLIDIVVVIIYWSDVKDILCV
jgi:hypothetical protein